MFKCDKIQIKTRYANYPGNDKINTKTREKSN